METELQSLHLRNGGHETYFIKFRESKRASQVCTRTYILLYLHMTLPIHVYLHLYRL